MNPTRLFVALLALGVGACSSVTEPEAQHPDQEVDQAQDLPVMWWADLGKACPADAPAPSLPDSSRVEARSKQSNMNERWADIARGTPGGWGGHFLDDGRWTMYLKDPTQHEAAVDTLRAQGMPVGYGYAVRQGRWDFAQMYDWYRYLDPHVASVDGTTMSDIQEARNRLEYGVLDEEVRAELEGVLSELDVPCHLVAIQRTGPWILDS